MCVQLRLDVSGGAGVVFSDVGYDDDRLVCQELEPFYVLGLVRRQGLSSDGHAILQAILESGGQRKFSVEAIPFRSSSALEIVLDSTHPALQNSQIGECKFIEQGLDVSGGVNAVAFVGDSWVIEGTGDDDQSVGLLKMVQVLAGYAF